MNQKSTYVNISVLSLIGRLSFRSVCKAGVICGEGARETVINMHGLCCDDRPPGEKQWRLPVTIPVGALSPSVTNFRLLYWYSEPRA
jgi:hypothetical protein